MLSRSMPTTSGREGLEILVLRVLILNSILLVIFSDLGPSKAHDLVRMETDAFYVFEVCEKISEYIELLYSL